MFYVLRLVNYHQHQVNLCGIDTSGDLCAPSLSSTTVAVIVIMVSVLLPGTVAAAWVGGLMGL